MQRYSPRLKHRAALAFVLLSATAAAAGAATYRHLAVTQTTGSGGATAFVQNTATGGALQGEVGSAANTGIKIPFGTLGEFNPPGSTFGVGVVGISTTGYALAGESLADSQPSILAYPGGKGPGLEAIATAQSPNSAIVTEAKGSGSGIAARADGAGSAVDARATDGYALLGQSANNTAAGIFSALAAGGAANIGLSSGEGVQALGYSGSAAHPALAAIASVSGTNLFATYNGAGTNGNSSGSASEETAFVSGQTLNRSGVTLPGGSDFQVSGDVYVYGHIYQDCYTFPAASGTNCVDVPVGSGAGTTIRTPSAHGDVAMYAARQTAPSVEDFGSARLVSGRGYVALDPAFAATMSHAKPYMVIVTANGPSESLYVTNRTPAGFEIHENHGGRSTVDFDYRIVGRPIVDDSVRLAAVRPEAKRGALPSAFVRSAADPKRHARVLVPPLDPGFVRAAGALTHR